jgi:hypothetical protein
MAVPDPEAEQMQDDYLLMSYIYINEDAEFISWVKACLDEWRMKNDSSEYTIPPVRLETTKYDIVGDTSFIPYEVTAYEEDFCRRSKGYRILLCTGFRNGRNRENGRERKTIPDFLRK